MLEPATAETRVVNDLGLHTRAATTLVKLAHTYASDIQIVVNGMSANAKSIMGLLALGARKGSEVQITASGPDQGDALAAIQKLFESGFYEEPQ